MNESITKKRRAKEEREANNSRRKRSELEDSPIYIVKEGLRKVEPYDFTYTAFAKGRWLKRTILDVFMTEFNIYKNKIYYTWAMEQGQIRVNGNIISPDYIVKDSDLLETTSHRHEPPVTSSKIEIVHESEDMLVVSKPCSIPMHPAGNYRHNTLLHILKFDMGYSDLYLVNRIDRLTSGLILIAKNKEKAAELSLLLMNRDISKTYLARVKGCFPEGIIECNEPLLTLSNKIGVNIVSSEGKPSTTIFTRISYNGITSVVKCQPKTGRTHQIRVHLQYLGYPIANDPHYCSDAWGPEYSKGGVNEDQMKILIDSITRKMFSEENMVSQSDFKSCIWCREKRVDPMEEQITLWLHSLRYEGEGWAYETEYPIWASQDYKGDAEIEKRFWNFGGKWDGKTPLDQA